ncbi:MAG TPA: MipA/OmpV family protein [Sphingobium sp.]|uniref:MipA/OmpV family protein n=1 Tax=Sphingobium sp. TaxID=1912891 RepID=UPI002ED0DA6E
MKTATLIIAIASMAFAISGSLAMAQDRDHVIVGVGVAQIPAYQGADSYRTLPIPVIDIVSGPIYANLRDGVGVHVVSGNVLTIGGGLGLMPGYRRRDVPEGVDRLSFGVGGRLFARLNAGGIVATIGGTRGFAGGSKGAIVDASLSYPLILSPRVQIFPSIGTSWSNARHNDRYFGIDADESTRSGLRRFDAGSGFKDVSAMLAANYRLTSRINLTVSGGLTSLLNEVKDSPLVIRRTQPMGFLSLSYRLGS